VSALKRQATGFTMIEVLVAVVVAGVGLLGLAKLQAASISNTQVARGRSLVAFQLESLAAAMHGNDAFWSSTAVPASFSMAGTTVTDASGVLNATPPNCQSSSCSAAQLAAYDVQGWAAAMNTHFPGYAAGVTCSLPTGTPATTPVSCALTASWQESYKALNQSTVGQTATQSLTLYVQP
jgi:type IV pilus assembly protein PilV